MLLRQHEGVEKNIFQWLQRKKMNVIVVNGWKKTSDRSKMQGCDLERLQSQPAQLKKQGLPYIFSLLQNMYHFSSHS